MFSVPFPDRKDILLGLRCHCRLNDQTKQLLFLHLDLGALPPFGWTQMSLRHAVSPTSWQECSAKLELSDLAVGTRKYRIGWRRNSRELIVEPVLNFFGSRKLKISLAGLQPRRGSSSSQPRARYNLTPATRGALQPNLLLKACQI
jgi:hypothetical protein